MPLLPAAKKAEAFAALLDGSPGAGAQLTTGQLNTLGALAQRLSSVPQPRPDFTAALRDRLISQATTSAPGAVGGTTGAAGSAAPAAPTAAAAPATVAPTTAAATGSSAATGVATTGSAVTSALAAAASSVWMPFTAFVAATGIAITGVAAGASISLPGDPLYGVKRQIETIQQELAGGAVDTAKAQLGFAAARLDEFVALVRENGDAPLSADLNRRLSLLLDNWAGDTSAGTTVLLQRLGAGTGDVTALRETLVHFTTTQARGLAAAVQQLPDAQLQSLTGSAFAYLQRLDTALGNPVQVARLLTTLGLPLPTVASSAAPARSSATPSAAASATTANPSSPAPGSTPTSIPTLPIPTGGRAVPKTSIPSVPVPVPSTGSTGQVGGAVRGTAGAVGQTVDGVLDGVTGNGPALPLPTAVPAPGVGR